MKYLKIFEEFDSSGYESHWDKFSKWLSSKDFELYDGAEDLKSKFLEIANDDNLAVEEKSNEISAYLDEKWGLYDGYMEVVDYLESLFMDEDGSEDEVEDARHTQPKQMNNPYYHESYTNLVYQSACDKLKEKIQDERTKYLISSLMPNYG